VRLSRERKVYLGVLGLGLSVLAADRLLFSVTDTQAATADSSLPPESSNAVPRGAAPEHPRPTEPAAAREPFSVRLAAVAVWSDYGMRDAFVAPAEWVGARPAPEKAAPKEPAESLFAQKYKVTAVMTTPQGGVAIINGKAHRVGEIVDGYTLVDIRCGQSDQGVVFQGRGTRIELTVPKPKNVDGVVRKQPITGDDADTGKSDPGGR